MEPLVFEPYLRPMVWGGRRLGDLLGKPLPEAGSYGESWEISAHPLHISQVAEGPYRGETLVDLCDQHPRDIIGEKPAVGSRFPLLIKFLDCAELLSIQVHPSDELAPRLAGEPSGKTEAWVVLEADPTARVYAGLKRGVTRADVEEHLAAGTLERCIHCFTPRPGDSVFLSAGTVHAVGGGVVMAEVQQTSDATFRLYDWGRAGPDGRPRQLHVQEALEAIRWDAGPVDPVTPEVIEGTAPTVREERLVSCPQFGLDRVILTGEARTGLEGRPSIWIVLRGSAELRTDGGYRRRFSRGETVLIPAAAAGSVWRTADGTNFASLLRIRLPESA
jgi:mannose-6-phosphate isomerase